MTNGTNTKQGQKYANDYNSGNNCNFLTEEDKKIGPHFKNPF